MIRFPHAWIHAIQGKALYIVTQACVPTLFDPPAWVLLHAPRLPLLFKTHSRTGSISLWKICPGNPGSGSDQNRDLNCTAACGHWSFRGQWRGRRRRVWTLRPTDRTAKELPRHTGHRVLAAVPSQWNGQCHCNDRTRRKGRVQCLARKPGARWIHGDCLSRAWNTQ